MVPGGGMNSDHPKQTFVKIPGGIRARPRGWDELGPARVKTCKSVQEPLEGSELVPGGGMSSDHPKSKFATTQDRKLRKIARGVRAGPRGRDELGPVRVKTYKSVGEPLDTSGGVRAGPRRWDELGPSQVKICDHPRQKIAENCQRGPSWSQGMG